MILSDTIMKNKENNSNKKRLKIKKRAIKKFITKIIKKEQWIDSKVYSLLIGKKEIF